MNCAALSMEHLMTWDISSELVVLVDTCDESVMDGEKQMCGYLKTSNQYAIYTLLKFACQASFFMRLPVTVIRLSYRR